MDPGSADYGRIFSLAGNSLQADRHYKKNLN
jgi:hypothetical protein